MANIYLSPTMGDARARVAVVSERGFADLWVCRVNSPGLAIGDERWFINADRMMARTVVHLCSVGMAQLTVCWVPGRGEAGWRVPDHPWRGRLR